MENSHKAEHSKDWYDKYYKLLLIIPIFILLLSIFSIISFYKENGDIINKDSSLAGGTSITIQGSHNIVLLESSLREKFSDIKIRSIASRSSSEPIALVVDSSAKPEELKTEIESILGITLDETNSSIEFSGESLSNSFYKQLLTALVISFILMSLVIFLLFRTFIPSLAVIFAVLGDIIIPLAILNYFNYAISAAGIAAFLMLIGYSVDTDILLTTRVLKKREGKLNSRIYSAFKTGIFMNISALLAVLPAFFLITSLPESFRQIFLILALGLCADIMNTWLTNASILKWYASSKGID